MRLALGARRGTVLTMVLSEAFRLLAAGALLGSVVLAFAVRFVQRMLYGISPFDPLTLLAAALCLAAVTFLAAFLPARRAASVDPMQALRAE